MFVDIVAAKDDVTAVEIATRIMLEVFSGLPTIDDNGIVIGMITTIDLLCAIRDGQILKLMFTRDLMTKNPLVVTQDTKIEDVIDIMDKNGIEKIPMVDKQTDKRLIDVVSRTDILVEKMNERVRYYMKRAATQ